jgi:hypothetical protein
MEEQWRVMPMCVCLCRDSGARQARQPIKILVLSERTARHAGAQNVNKCLVGSIARQRRGSRAPDYQYSIELVEDYPGARL